MQYSRKKANSWFNLADALIYMQMYPVKSLLCSRQQRLRILNVLYKIQYQSFQNVCV